MDNKRTEWLNGMLRAELSAAETYSRMLETSASAEHHQEYERIREDHRESARLLNAQIIELGGIPSDEASTWQNIATLVSIAHSPSDPSALKALIAGEEQDLLTYQGALGDAALDGEARELVESMLMPRTEAHLTTLRKYLTAA
jgi:bacterioferritin (cytochrome b1)